MTSANRQFNYVAPFFDLVDIELKRAERYRIFISLIVFDLSFTEHLLDAPIDRIIEEMVPAIRRNIRAIDNVAVIGESKIALLFPETTRQGAEIASKRVGEMIKEKVATTAQINVDKVIPREMASYPDAAGAKSIYDFLREYSRTNVN